MVVAWPLTIRLKLGTHNRVVVERPKIVKAVGAGFGGFPFNSSFPTPVALVALLAPSYTALFGELLGASTAPYYQFFGHAQAEGNLSQNKDLSERRAKALAAVLTGDSAQLKELARSENWGDAESQVMWVQIGSYWPECAQKRRFRLF